MRRSLILVAVLALAACQREQPAPAATPAPPAAPAAAAAPAIAADAPQLPAGPHTFDAAIRAEDFATHVQNLASDEFEGRSPGSIGERMTTTYLKTEFERMGLKPGNGDSFFQSVPMVETRVQPGAKIEFKIKDQTLAPTYGAQMVLGTRSGQASVEVPSSELVFVGYGVVAPEFDWNDYAGVDVKGKTVVVLVNDPGFIRKDPALFKGQAMTYYGRWTYKFEEAARQGAAGALIVHETEAAAYGWEVVQNGWGGPSFDLPPSEDAEPRLPFQGWLQGDAASALFTAAGLDLQQLRLAADQRGFKAVPMGGMASVSFKTIVRNATSDNVVALLPGSERPDEAVVVMGHWDHLGRTFSAPDGDKIFNGAVDNATGSAGVLEIAEAFALGKDKPKRSILFLLPTLEESGLLGSRYFAAHPTMPLPKLIAAVNMDALPVHGRARDFAVIGYGQSDLDALLAEVLKAQDRVAVPEPTPESGFYFRSDHFNFARVGVPALYGRGGIDLREGGVEAGKAEATEYTAKRYHKTADEFDPGWDVSSPVEDVQAFYAVARRIADSDLRPQWSADSEFRAAGEARLKAR
jgi:Zn-dependent M28 family amino/carboxypeptidase